MGRPIVVGRLLPFWQGFGEARSIYTVKIAPEAPLPKWAAKRAAMEAVQGPFGGMPLDKVT